MITISNISKSYSMGLFKSISHKVLDSISLTVDENEVFGIIGPNGAGKSTLLKILMGFITPDDGYATISDIPVTDSTSRSCVGFLPEHPALYQHLSPFEHLHFALHLDSYPEKSTLRQNILEILNIVDLAHVIDTPVRQFSKGMQQRTALAYALLTRPKVLILDEPMSGLDPLGRSLVIDIMRDFHQKGTTIIFCSHILSDIERICDRIGILDKGQLLSIIEPDFLTTVSKPSLSGRTPLEHYFLSQVLANKSQSN